MGKLNMPKREARAEDAPRHIPTEELDDAYVIEHLRDLRIMAQLGPAYILLEWARIRTAKECVNPAGGRIGLVFRRRDQRTNKVIADECGISVRVLRRHRKFLVEHGSMKVKRTKYGFRWAVFGFIKFPREAPVKAPDWVLEEPWESCQKWPLSDSKPATNGNFETCHLWPVSGPKAAKTGKFLIEISKEQNQEAFPESSPRPPGRKTKPSTSLKGECSGAKSAPSPTTQNQRRSISAETQSLLRTIAQQAGYENGSFEEWVQRNFCIPSLAPIPNDETLILAILGELRLGVQSWNGPFGQGAQSCNSLSLEILRNCRAGGMIGTGARQCR